MTEDKKYVETTNEQLTMIKTYLSSRLGMFGIKDYDFETEKNNKNYLIHKISPRFLGINRCIMDECVLHVTIHPQIEIKHGTQNGRVNLSLRYTHYDGGSNGHDLNFHLIFSNSQVYEVTENE